MHLQMYRVNNYQTYITDWTICWNPIYSSSHLHDYVLCINVMRTCSAADRNRLASFLSHEKRGSALATETNLLLLFSKKLLQQNSTNTLYHAYFTKTTADILRIKRPLP